MKGKNNNIIRKAIENGLRLNEKGEIVLPNGNVCLGAKGGANGYKKVWLKDNGRNVGFTKARIVCWLAHGEPPKEDLQVDHINHDRTDDRPENLRWSSAQENSNNITSEERHRRKEERVAYHAEFKRLKESHEDLVKALEFMLRQPVIDPEKQGGKICHISFEAIEKAKQVLAKAGEGKT